MQCRERGEVTETWPLNPSQGTTTEVGGTPDITWHVMTGPEKLARLHGFGFHGTQQRVDHFVEANNLTRNEARLWLRLSGKESTCQSRRRRRYRFNPRSGKSPGGGNDNPLSALAWKKPWTEESGGLESMESQRVGPD